MTKPSPQKLLRHRAIRLYARLKKVNPNCENTKIYKKKYGAYKKIYDAVRSIIEESK